jgi:hypothetical protein
MKRLMLAAVAATLVVSSTGLVRADQPGADWMPAEQVKQKLTQAGYSQITELKADDGRWEGEGVKNGTKMEFHADPRTGAIIQEKKDD